MAYLNDVCLVINKTLLKEMMEEIPEALKEIASKADRIQRCGKDTLFLWKQTDWWYSNIFPVKQISNFLYDEEAEKGRTEEDFTTINDERAIHFYFLRIGESIGDIEENGDYEDNPWKTTIVSRIEVDYCGKDVDLKTFM